MPRPAAACPSFRVAAVSVGLALLVSGCGIYRGAIGNDAGLIRGIEPRIEDLRFTEVAASQSDLIVALQEQANLKDVALPTQDNRWGLVLRAGIQLVDGRCDQYLDVLFRFNREQRAARKGLTAATAATASIMGLTGAAAKAVAVVATALGLATVLFDANVDSILFQIEPSALRNIVLQGRQKYISELKLRTDNLKSIDTRPDMMIALQGYLTQCSPAAIEANINNAANGSPFAVTIPFVASRNDVQTGISAVSTGTPSVELLGQASAPLSQRLPLPARQVPAVQNRTTITLPGFSTLGRDTANHVLAALGMSASTVSDRTVTAAIAQVQLARGRHDVRYLNEPRGTLEGPRIRDTLIGLGPMPAQFHTPFERFSLGVDEAFDTLDPDKMGHLREELGLPALPPGSDLWTGVRPALQARRGASRPVSLNAGVSDAAALDAALNEVIDPRTPTLQPAPRPAQ